MDKLEEFDNNVYEILENVGDDPAHNLLKCADKIHSLADYSRNMPIFKTGNHVGTEFFKDSTPVEIYKHMIYKIAESPTKFHTVAAVVLTVPYLSDKLKELE